MNKTCIKSLFIAALTTVTIIVCYFFLDRHLAQAAYSLKHTIWHTLAKQLSLCASSNFFQVILAVGFLVGVYDGLSNGLTHRSKCILYMCTTIAAAIIIGDVLKDLFGRARPPLLFEKGLYGFSPMTGGYMHSSFPSGHSIRIFSAMTALGVVLPRIRIPALTLATLVGISRVLALKHYPSDVLFGAFIGISAALWGWRILYPYGHKEVS